MSSMARPPTSPPLFFSLLLSVLLSSAAAVTRLPVHHRTATPSWESFPALAAASVARARHLKTPQKRSFFNPATPSSTYPLFSHSYGGYTVSFGFGTPPQRIPLLIDTGSDLVWLPCTRSFVCKNCSFPPVFVPRSSSSVKLVGCRNPKCSWIHPSEILSGCRNSNSSVCPPYLLLHGSTSTGGLLLSEKLDISPEISGFAVGCSLFSSGLPSVGVAGFGRGLSSLPSQLKLHRFSYCLVSGAVGYLNLNTSSIDGFSFTPFLKNKPEYYYVGLRNIKVDGHKVRRVSVEEGAVIDSGTAFTYLEPEIFRTVEEAVMAAAAGKYNRSVIAEKRTGLPLCFAAADEKVRFPKLSLHFNGGAVMRLPVENSFAVAGGEGAACLAVVTDSGGRRGGPAVILGSFQQQNFAVVYDLEKNRLGFRRQTCVERKKTR